jgi:hypothetical protein
MMALRKLSLWDRLLIRLFPARCRRYEAGLETAIRWLVEHPEEPVRFE